MSLQFRRWLVSGRVQGVAFRWFTRENALRLSIVGSVRNLPDGRVEVHAAGDPEQLESLRRLLNKGPSAAEVTTVEEKALSEASLSRLEASESFEITS